jgi:WD40 repeat protein
MGTAEGYVLLCDLTTGRKLWQSTRVVGGIHSLALDPRGLLAAGTENGSIVVWSAGHQRIAALRGGHRAIVSALSFGKQGALASGGLDGAVLLWPPVRRRSGGERPPRARTLQAGGSQVVDLVFGGGGLLVPVGAAGATVWNVARRDRIAVELPAAAQTGALISLALTGTMLASGDDSGTVWIRDVKSGHAAPRLRLRSAVSALAFSGDGRTLAAGDVGGMVKIWKAAKGAVQTLSTPQNERVMGLVFGADGRSLIGGDPRGTLIGWDLSTGAATTLETLNAGIRSLAASPARDTLAVVDDQGDILIATLESASLRLSAIGRHEFATQVAYAPDGSFVASAGSDGSIRLWDPSRPNTFRALRPSVRDSVASLAISSDSRLLAAAAGSEVRMWDVRAGGALGLPLVRPRAQLYAVVFGADGMLVSGGFDRSAGAWTTNHDRWRSLACTTANRTLTRDEWEEFVGAAFAFDPPCSS